MCSVDEVQVSSTNNNAEFAQAGDITVTSKSGTNDLHGNVYRYHQNGAFDARDFFAVRRPFEGAAVIKRTCHFCRHAAANQSKNQ